MAGKRSIVNRIVAVFDRQSHDKASRDIQDALQRAGKQGGKKAGEGFLKDLRDTFNKRKAQLSEQLARGTIDQKEFRKQTAIAAKTFNDGLLKGIEQARKEGKLTDKEYIKLTRRIKRVGDEGQRSIGGKLVASLKKAALAAGAFFSARAVFRWVQGSVEAFAEFDHAMQRSIAIMGDVDDAMRQKMERTARDVAKELNISAAEIAEGYFFLASAGLNAAQSVEALPQAATFAKAGAFDLATAVDLLTDAQSALGLTVEDTTQNLRNQTRVSDVLVRANTLANATVQQFSESLTNRAGAALKTFNRDVEEGVAVLAAYADQGTKGAEAGTNFSRILRLLTTAATNNTEALKDLGIELADAQGNMLPLADQIENITNALHGMSDTQRQAALQSIGFTARVQDALLPLLGTSDAIREYERELREASGTTRDLANKQMEAFAEQMGRLQQKIADLRIELGQKLAPVLKGAADNFDEILIAVQALVKALVVSGAILAFTRLAAAIRAARLATDAWRISMASAWTMIGPKGWFIIGVAALTEAFRRQGMAAREAARDIESYMDSLQTMSKEELEDQREALMRQRDELLAQIERLEAGGTASGRARAQKLRESLGQVFDAFLEVNRLLSAMDTEDPTADFGDFGGDDAGGVSRVFADRKAAIDQEIADLKRLVSAHGESAEAVDELQKKLGIEADARAATAGLSEKEAARIRELIALREEEREKIEELQRAHQMRDRKAQLDQEIRDLRRVAEAHREGEEAVRATERELQLEAETRKETAGLRDAEARQIERLIELRQQEREAIEAAQQAAVQQASVAALERSIEVLNRRAAALEQGADAVEELARQEAIEQAVMQSGAEAGSEHAQQIADLAGIHYDTAQEVEGAWSAAFAAMRSEADATATLIQGLFQALASGGLAGLAQFAKNKAIENLAWAAENFAKAWGWIGSLNPVAAAAAKKAAVGHLGAAAKWSAVAGGAAAASGSGGGGGSSAGPGGFRPSRASTNTADRSEPAGPEVHIYIDPLNPSSPAYQRHMGETMRYVRERYGENFTIHPRRGGN